MMGASPVAPNPTEARDFKQAEGSFASRRIGCAHTTACLDVAARGGWEGLSCVACSAFTPLSPAAREADRDPLLALLAVVCDRSAVDDVEA